MLPILFTIPKFHLGSYTLGPFPIHSYGVMLVVAFLAAMWLIKRRSGRYGVNPEKIVDMGYWGLIAGVLGARIVYLLQELPYYLKHTNELFSLQFSGLTSFGGEIFAVVAIIFWARKSKYKIVKILDLAAPGYALGYAIGRVGCFLNGCCYGGVCSPNLPWGVHFADSRGGPHHPAQLYDALMNVGVMAILLTVEKRKLVPDLRRLDHSRQSSHGRLLLPRGRIVSQAKSSPSGATMLSKVLFWIIAVSCCVPLLKVPEKVLAFVAPGALILGIGLALSVGNPFPNEAKKVSKVLLQAAVVLLGFSMDLQKVVDAGRSGLVFALISISGVFLLGWAIQKVLNVRPLTSLLVSTGTAICGGSAIAAMSTVTDAPQEDVSVAVGTVFLLNAVALVLFPPLGHLMKMTPDQFGTWSGIAIHDVSSVVGAATAFGGGAVQTATAVKLSRVLYLVPITLVVALLRKRSSGPVTASAAPIPWFIGLFILASVLSTYVQPIHTLGPSVKLIALAGFALSLFLIGTGISKKTLKAVGVRPLIQGVLLWIFISVGALVAVMKF